MTTTTFWGEERELDAVYNVYLKKVKYSGSATDYQEASTSGTSSLSIDASQQHLQWETVKERVIKAGSLAKLLRCLINREGELETRHFNVFFATYRAFASTFSVLQLLLARYSDLVEGTEQFPNDRIKERTRRTLKCLLNYWLDMYPEDFWEPPKHDSLIQLVEFCRYHDDHLRDIKVKAKLLYERIAENASSDDQSTYYGKDGVSAMSDGSPFEPPPSLSATARYISLDPQLTRPDITRSEPGFIAGQLTCRESLLFRKVLLHQCQGHFWWRRNKTRKDRARVATVIATVDHFNLVSTRVMSSVLMLEHPTRQHRARVIESWIDVAEELHYYKNFATLKAVVSGLLSQPVHRLESVWALISKEQRELLDDLSNINSHDALDKDSGIVDDDRLINNRKGATKDSRLRRQQRARSDMSLMDIQGMVPYLGKFLTDLTIIDDAFQNTVDGLINFEKRRKEFEVMAKLKLYQSAASSYQLELDPDFDRWFNLFPCLPSGDCDKLSLIIEPPKTSTPNSDKREHSRNGSSSDGGGGGWPHILGRLPRSSSSRDATIGGDEDGFYSIVPNGNSKSQALTLPPTVGPTNTTSSSAKTTPNRKKDKKNNSSPGGSLSRRVCQLRAESAFYVDQDQLYYYAESEFDPRALWNGSTPPANGHAQEVQENSTELAPTPLLSQQRAKPPKPPQSAGKSMVSSRSSSAIRAPAATATSSAPGVVLPRSASATRGVGGTSLSGEETLVVRIHLDDALLASRGPIDGEPNYKSILMTNGDRMWALVSRALERHLLAGSPSDYCLVQIRANGAELALPDTSNPYYAAAKEEVMNFVLRPKYSNTNNNTTTAVTVKRAKKKISLGANNTMEVQQKNKGARRKRSNNLLTRWSSGYL